MKMATDRNYGLEDRLADLRRRFASYAYDGVALTAEDVVGLIWELEQCRDEAARLARELSASRWNDRAAFDEVADLVLAEAGRPGTNLLLFPVVGRPIPGDALQTGGER